MATAPKSKNRKTAQHLLLVQPGCYTQCHSQPLLTILEAISSKIDVSSHSVFLLCPHMEQGAGQLSRAPFSGLNFLPKTQSSFFVGFGGIYMGVCACAHKGGGQKSIHGIFLNHSVNLNGCYFLISVPGCPSIHL